MKQNKLVFLKSMRFLLCFCLLFSSLQMTLANDAMAVVDGVRYYCEDNFGPEATIKGIEIENTSSAYTSGILNIPGVLSLNFGSGTKTYNVRYVQLFGTVRTNNAKITTLNFPEGVEYIGWCGGRFVDNYNKSTLTSIHLPSTLKKLQYDAFKNETELSSVTLPSSIDEIGERAFLGCSKLTTINFPSSLKTIRSSAFKDCSLLENADLSNTQITTFANCPEIFSNCTSLKTVKLPPHLAEIGIRDFSNCTSLEGITFPATLTKIGDDAFNGCKNMKGDLNIPNSVVSIGEEAFNECSNLDGTLYLSNHLQSIGNSAFDHCGKLHYDFANLPQSLMDIGTWAFRGNMSFTGTPIIPPGMTSLYRTFSDTGISGDVVVPNNIIQMWETFDDCPNLRNVTLPTTITSLGNDCFRGTKSLEKLHIPGNIKKIGRRLLFGSGIKELTIDEGLEEIDQQDWGYGVFMNCNNLKEIRFPSTLKKWDYSWNLCWSCENLERVVLPTNSAITFIPAGAFANCPKLKEIYIPDNIKEIQQSAFSGDVNLTSLRLPQNLEALEDACFGGLLNLKGKITLPASLKKYPKGGAFGNCSQLKAIVFEGGREIEFTTYVNMTGYPSRSAKSGLDGCDSLVYVDMKNVAASSFKADMLPLRRDVEGSLFYRARPYVMIYLPEGVPTTGIKSGEENFVAGNPYTCDNFVAYDNYTIPFHIQNLDTYITNSWGLSSRTQLPIPEYTKPCDYPIQYDFTATKANYKNRAFTGETCKTLYLPYPTALPAGMAAYELTRLNGSTVYQFTSITAPTLQANHPYLLRIEDGAASKSFAEEHGVSVPASPDITTTALTGTNDSGWRFMGTTVTIDNEPAANMHAYNLDADTWYPVRTDTPTGYIHPFRCFIQSTTGAAAKNFTMIFDNGKTPTAIDTVKAAEQAEADMKSGRYPFYTLDGRNMGSDYNSLPQGRIYIVNGHKFYKF